MCAQLIFAIELLSDRILLSVACCMFCFVVLFALDGSDCVSFISFTTLENEEGDIGEEAYFHSCYFQEQNQDQYQGKPSWCLLLYYLSLSIMHVFTSAVLHNLVNKTIFVVAITTINIIFNYHIASSQTWCYQAFSHHMVYKYHLTN